MPKPGAPPVWEAAWREAHAQVWEAVVPLVNRHTGQERWQKQRFVELATGLNYQDAQGQWQRTREVFEPLADGSFVARHGPHQLIVGPNVNDWVVDFRGPDGLRLRAGPVALGYFDPVSGTNLLLATVRDAPGRLTAPNEVTFADCFEGLKASLRVTYRRAGVSSDLLLHEAPPAPETLGLSGHSRLELYTELHPDDPAPRSIPRILRTETDPALRQSLAEPDLVDEELDFGAYRMGPGTAFEVHGRTEQLPVPVLKRYLELPEGRRILIEAVEYREARKHFAALPNGGPASRRPWDSPDAEDEALAQRRRDDLRESPSLQVLAETVGRRGTRGTRPSPREASTALRPLPLLTRVIPSRKTVAANVSSRHAQATAPLGRELAALSRAQPQPGAAPPGPAFLLDWSLLTGDTNVTLAGDTTYFVSGNVYLYGTTTLEGGAVVKYTNEASLYLRGPVDCQTSPYRPAVFTSLHDDSVGQVLPGSTGNPFTNHCAHLALEFNTYATNVSVRLEHLRVAHARYGLSLSGGQDHEVRHAQFVRCQMALVAAAAEVRLRNVLVHQVGTLIGSMQSPTLHGEHLTVNQAQFLNLGSTPALYFTNSLFVAVTNLGDYEGSNNVSTNDPADVFASLGAGAHYLLSASPLRSAGTTNLQPELLAELRQRTTDPPQWLTHTVTADTWLTPVAPRDRDRPDLGWHYPAVDYAAWLFTITNHATVRVAPGTVIATFGPTAVWMPDGSQLLCEGTPRQPVQWTPFYAVQEQSTNWGGYWPASTTKLNPWHWSSAQPAPTARFRFTDFHGMSGEGWHVYTDEDVWSFATFAATDSSFSSAGAWFAGPEGSAYSFTNCLFERIFSGALIHSPEVHFYNNHMRGGDLTVWNLGSAVWRFHDNVFDGVWLGGTDVTHSHNAYLDLPDPSCRLTPTNATDLVTNDLAWQTGPLGRDCPLGRYYQPSDSPLRDAGSRWATNAGLYHYTTTTNQVKEGATMVDIGLHYVALVGTGPDSQALDFDEDGIADWCEDFNGNGVVDAGESSFTNATVALPNGQFGDYVEPWPLTLPDPSAYGAPHEEREYKYSIRNVVSTHPDDNIARHFAERIDRVLMDAISNTWANWAVSNALVPFASDPDVWDTELPLAEGAYVRTENRPSLTIFMDFYLDTATNLNYFQDISYRLRQRFISTWVWQNYVEAVGGWRSNMSWRVETMSKVNRRYDTNKPGWSAVTEATHAWPFVIYPPHPAAEIDAVLDPVMRGRNPCDTVTDYAKAYDPPWACRVNNAGWVLRHYLLTNGLVGPYSILEYRPKVVVVSERRRQHLAMKGLHLLWVQEAQRYFTNCYIVSVDSAHVFPLEPMLEFMRGTTNVMPAELGSFVELEIEFERDIADTLDDMIVAESDQGRRANLEALRDAFLQDQDTLISLITDHVNSKSVTDLTAMYTVKGELAGNDRFVAIPDTGGVSRDNIVGIIQSGLGFTNEVQGGFLIVDTETRVWPLTRPILNRNSQPPSDFIITEFSTRGNDDAIRDADGHTHDWIEIQNTSAEARSLDGWYLSNTGNKTLCPFPSGISVLPGKFIVVFATSTTTTTEPLHFAFDGGGLDAQGEDFTLTGTDGTTVRSDYDFPSSYDIPDFGYDVTFGARWDGSSWEVGYMTPTAERTNTTVYVPRRTFGGDTNASVSLWLKTAATNSMAILGFGLSDDLWQTGERQLFLDAQGRLHFAIGAGSGNEVATSASVNDGSWHHIVVTNTVTGATAVFIDGTNAVAGTLADSNSSGPFLAQFLLGGNVAHSGMVSRNFVGVLDEVAIWSRALSTTEVQQIHTNGLAGKTIGATEGLRAGLLHYFSMDERLEPNAADKYQQAFELTYPD